MQSRCYVWNCINNGMVGINLLSCSTASHEMTQVFIVILLTRSRSAALSLSRSVLVQEGSGHRAGGCNKSLGKDVVTLSQKLLMEEDPGN